MAAKIYRGSQHSVIRPSQNLILDCVQSVLRVSGDGTVVGRHKRFLFEELHRTEEFFKACEKMKGWRYATSAVDLEGIPTHNRLQLGPQYPEFALAGESNAGKSTLLNLLAGKEAQRVALAKASRRAGRTQMLNFFTLHAGVNGCLVDLPGYGGALVPDSQVEKWQELVGDYLRLRSEQEHRLRLVFILTDIVKGISNRDRYFMDYLEELGIPFQLVLTKADTLTSARKYEGEVKRARGYLQKKSLAEPFIHVLSAPMNFGVTELRATLLAKSRTPIRPTEPTKKPPP